MTKILVMGASGMVGGELVPALREKYGKDNVIASDLKEEAAATRGTGPYIILNAVDAAKTRAIVEKEGITEIYLLAGLLSVAGEKDPIGCWEVNTGGLRQVLELAKEKKIKVFWPSSIAAFGPTTPKIDTPQKTVIEPTTMYGITKYAGELLCQYYWKRYGVDVRSLRYPGLLSWKTEPGPGTTEYAVEIFYGALKDGRYTVPLKPDTYLPMMYMDDAIRATLEIMAAPSEKIKNRMSYNLSAMSFSPAEIAAEIKKHLPLEVSYEPDARQAIADSWPKNIDDSTARRDFGWQHQYDLSKMVEIMLENLKIKLGK